MRDPRLDEYARLLVDRSVAVQPGWQVSVRGTPLARPLLEAVIEQIARRGAYPILQMTFEQIGGPFARQAPVELLREPAPLQRRIWEEVDAFISIWAPENTREGSELSDERRAAAITGGVPCVWNDSIVFRPQAWPLARSACVQVTVSQSGAKISRPTALHSSILLPPGS